jgi:hypothetical protein
LSFSDWLRKTAYSPITKQTAVDYFDNRLSLIDLNEVIKAPSSFCCTGFVAPPVNQGLVNR